jgi:FHS family L-fucose permease-like MFS transporter
MAGPIPVANSGQASKSGGGSVLMIAAVVALFFLWGGLTSLNDILIPKLKDVFALTYTQAMLTQFAFFTAYAVISLPAGVIIARLGYVRGIVLGLTTMAAGCLLFVPASSSGVYATFLGALFVVASGITVLQVAANPLIANMGDPATSHSRLTLAQAFNALGTTVFPPVGALVILGSLSKVDPTRLSATERAAFQAREAAVIGHAYVFIALALIAIAAFFWWRRHALDGGRAESASLKGAGSLLRHRRLAGAVASIFLYVGAEVSIGSMLVSYLSQPQVMGISHQAAGALVAFYWGGAMIGRFVGAFVLRRVSPGLLLAAMCCGAVALAALSASSSGPLSGYAILAIGLMNSIMFPTIFSLGVEGLGPRTPQASGLLCMAIMGGAIVPLLAGAVADAVSLSAALTVPVLCYLLIAAYGWSARRPAVVADGVL